MTSTLTVEERTARGKQLRKLRSEDKLPAVVYGPKEDTHALTLGRKDFEKVLHEAGESSIITLTGVGEDKEVLIHDLAFDPVKGGVIHVDFYAIERGKELTVDVPLEYIGEAPAVKLGGSLTKVLHEIEVTCRPSALPKNITVDVSSLVTFEDQIQIKDLPIPEGVTVENESEEVVAMVQEVEEEAEEPAEAVDMDAIEVEEKGKKDEDEDEGESKDSK